MRIESLAPDDLLEPGDMLLLKKLSSQDGRLRELVYLVTAVDAVDAMAHLFDGGRASTFSTLDGRASYWFGAGWSVL